LARIKSSTSEGLFQVHVSPDTFEFVELEEIHVFDLPEDPKAYASDLLSEAWEHFQLARQNNQVEEWKPISARVTSVTTVFRGVVGETVEVGE
jgi:hypothetical protein